MAKITEFTNLHFLQILREGKAESGRSRTSNLGPGTAWQQRKQNGGIKDRKIGDRKMGQNKGIYTIYHWCHPFEEKGSIKAGSVVAWKRLARQLWPGLREGSRDKKMAWRPENTQIRLTEG